MAGPYTTTIYAALPGTPLIDKFGKSIGTSAAGHMWYDVQDGQGNINSYGFAPKEHGAASGPGKGYDSDTDMYQNPRFSRTIEVSAEQYAKLKAFGEAATKEEWRYFKGEYQGLTNSCVDFTWSALKHAGLQVHHPEIRSKDGKVVLTPEYTGPIEKRFEGRAAPGHIRVDIEQIVAPQPNSPLNKARENPPPSGATFLQKIISDNGPAGQPDSAAANPTSLQADQAQRFKDQLGPKLVQLGMNGQQVDTLAAAAAKEQTRFAGQGETQAFHLRNDGSAIALLQAHPPLREFSVEKALGQSEQAHWQEAAAMAKPPPAAPSPAPTQQPTHEMAQAANASAQPVYQRA